MKEIKTVANDFSKNHPRRNNFTRKKKPFGRGRPNRATQNIDPARFIKKPSAEVAEKIEIQHVFDDFCFNEKLKGNLIKRNFKVPTPIQDQAIPQVLLGRDLIGIADTGTGKTGAFLLPMIEKVSQNPREKVFIVAPTRELALQIEAELHKFSFGMNIFYATCVGGMPMGKQIGVLRRNPNFVIGTPGRLQDLEKRGILKLSEFTNVVLDEVDRMFDMGFVNEIRDVLNRLPKRRQSLFFSATMPSKIRDLAASFLVDPVTVKVKSGDTAANVEQDVVKVSGKGMKFYQLQELLSDPELSKVLIFAETKREVEALSKSLTKEGFMAESIHGDKRQGQRQRALSLFKNNKVSILVATDVAARGLDIKDITHVINYTIPNTYEDYVHRIGRTGRGNSLGKALTFVDSF